MNETSAKKGLSQPVLILVVLAILAAIGLVVVFGISKKAESENTIVMNVNNEMNKNSNLLHANLVNGNDVNNAPPREPVEKWVSYTNLVNGYSFSYPSNWVFREYQSTGSGDNTVEISSDEQYPVEREEESEGFKIYVGKGTISRSTSDEEVLRSKDGKEVLPLVTEKFLTISNLTTLREYRQLRKGEPLLDGYPIVMTRTVVQYTLRDDENLFYLTLQVDSNEPESVIAIFDELARTFSVSQEK